LALIEQTSESKHQRALELAGSNARQFPQLPEIASTHGWVLYKLGRLDDAERAFRIASSAKAPSLDTACYLARLSVDRGRGAEARQLLENALKSNRLFMFRQEAQDLLKQLK
jgi:uncharacterized protein HemY